MAATQALHGNHVLNNQSPIAATQEMRSHPVVSNQSPKTGPLQSSRMNPVINQIPTLASQTLPRMSPGGSNQPPMQAKSSPKIARPDHPPSASKSSPNLSHGSALTPKHSNNPPTTSTHFVNSPSIHQSVLGPEQPSVQVPLHRNEQKETVDVKPDTNPASDNWSWNNIWSTANKSLNSAKNLAEKTLATETVKGIYAQVTPELGKLRSDFEKMATSLVDTVAPPIKTLDDGGYDTFDLILHSTESIVSKAHIFTQIQGNNFLLFRNSEKSSICDNLRVRSIKGEQLVCSGLAEAVTHAQVYFCNP
jgi:hypothetical protein